MVSSSARVTGRPAVRVSARRGRSGGSLDTPAGLHFAGHAEYSGMLEAVGGLEVVVGLVEDEVGLAGQTAQAALQTLVEGLQAGAEGFGIGLVARSVGRVGGTQVGGHLRGYDPGVGRQQPQVRIQAAGAVGVIVLLGGLLLVLVG